MRALRSRLFALLAGMAVLTSGCLIMVAKIKDTHNFIYEVDTKVDKSINSYKEINSYIRDILKLVKNKKAEPWPSLVQDLREWRKFYKPLAGKHKEFKAKSKTFYEQFGSRQDIRSDDPRWEEYKQLQNDLQSLAKKIIPLADPFVAQGNKVIGKLNQHKIRKVNQSEVIAQIENLEAGMVAANAQYKQAFDQARAHHQQAVLGNLLEAPFVARKEYQLNQITKKMEAVNAQAKKVQAAGKRYRKVSPKSGVVYMGPGLDGPADAFAEFEAESAKLQQLGAELNAAVDDYNRN